MGAKANTSKCTPSDEELAILFQNGDSNAFTTIVARYASIVKGRASGYYGSELEPDDLAQDGMIGLLNAAKTFCDNKGASFKTYAILCIDRSIISTVRRVLADRRIPDSDIVPMDLISDQSEISCSGPEETLINAQSIEEYIKQFEKILSGFEYKVFIHYIGGCGYDEIAQRLGVEVKSIDNALCRIKSKLKGISF